MNGVAPRRRPYRNKSNGAAAASEALKESDRLGLCTKEELSAWRALEGARHQGATDSLSLVDRIDEDLAHTREEVVIGQNAYGTNQLVAVPRSDILGLRQRDAGAR